jgi:predicted nucleotidyltransferase
MDYLSPIEAVIPGAQGRVLRVLANTEHELTMRTVAGLAGVSVGQTAEILRRLIGLGLVERRDAGSAALVRLVRENEAVQVLLLLNNLRASLLSRLKREAASIQPSPACLVLFGSFARGEAREESDLDVLAVAPPGLTIEAEQDWDVRLGAWTDTASSAVGNPVNLLRMSLEDLRYFKGNSKSLWRDIERDGTLLAGSAPRTLLDAPR